MTSREQNRPRQGVSRVEALVANDTLYLRFWGEPIAQPRPRARLSAMGRIIMYDPSTRFRAAAQVLLTAALTEIGENDRPVYTRSHSLRVTAKYYSTDPRKDVDNLLKFSFDCLQGPVLADDRYIVEVKANKFHVVDSAEARTDVEIEYY